MTKKIYLGGKYSHEYAIVDDEDYEYLSQFKWHKHDKGYVVRCNKYRHKPSNIFMHREIMGVVYEPTIEIDHEDNNKLNCVRKNLRRCTRPQNCRNTPKISKKQTKSRYKGVYPRGKNWCAKIKINKKNQHLGTYSTEEAAAIAYDKRAIELFGEFANTNFQEIDENKLTQDRVIQTIGLKR